MTTLPFITGTGQGRSRAVDGQDLINFYLEYYGVTGQKISEYYGATKQAKSNMVAYPTPGLTIFNQDIIADSKVRCIYTTSTNRMFAVIGNQFLEYNIHGAKVYKGTLLTSNGTVSMIDCGNGSGRGFGICLVDGEYGYNYNLTNNTFEQITDPSFPKYPGTVIFMNGFFIINELNSARFWYSQQYDCLDWGDIDVQYLTKAYLPLQTGSVDILLEFANGLPAVNDTIISAGMWVTITNQASYLAGVCQSYNPTTGHATISINNFGGAGSLDIWTVDFYLGTTRFYTAEGLPDSIKTITTIRNDLWIMGELSTEIWYNPIGYDINNPFVKRTTFLNNGTVATNSVATNGDNLFWLGSSAAGFGQIWMSDNYTPMKISSNSIDHMIESLNNIKDAIGWCYTQDGHNFYVLSFNSGNKTLVYDISTKEWHERAEWDGKKYNRYIGNCHTLFNDLNLVGDYRNSNIYKLDLNQYTENSRIVRRLITGPHIHQDRQRIFFKEFEVDIERGVGLDGKNSIMVDPQAFLVMSDDGGYTWSNEYWGQIGGRGAYKTRLHWHRLGMSRDRIFRLIISDPVKIVLIGARGDISIENANAPVEG